MGGKLGTIFAWAGHAPDERGRHEARRRAHFLRPSLVYCGDNRRAKKVYLEPFTLLIAQLAYEGDEGPKIAYRFERF